MVNGRQFRMSSTFFMEIEDKKEKYLKKGMGKQTN